MRLLKENIEKVGVLWSARHTEYLRIRYCLLTLL